VSLDPIPLPGGGRIPRLGVGTWRLSDDEAGELIPAATRLGVRHIDTAQAYENEGGVGRGIRASGVAREDLFVTSKQRTRDQGRDGTRRSLEGSLERLGLDYLDLFLIHWPMPERDLYVDTWRVLVEAAREGLVRSIGVSNFLPEHVDRLVAETGAAPAVNQVELHPLFQQRDLREHHARLDVVVTSYSPFGGDGAPALTHPVVRDIAATHGATPAQVVLRWHLDQGLVVVPKTASAGRLAESAAALEVALDDDDIRRIGALDAPDGKRLPSPLAMNDLF